MICNQLGSLTAGVDRELVIGEQRHEDRQFGENVGEVSQMNRIRQDTIDEDAKVAVDLKVAVEGKNERNAFIDLSLIMGAVRHVNPIEKLGKAVTFGEGAIKAQIVGFFQEAVADESERFFLMSFLAFRENFRDVAKVRIDLWAGVGVVNDNPIVDFGIPVATMPMPSDRILGLLNESFVGNSLCEGRLGQRT